MRVLIVQNYEGTGPGLIGQALEEAGVAVDLVRPYRGEAIPEGVTDHAGVVVLGGAQNARADDTHPYMPGLVAYMKATVDAGRPLLGVCLGAQLLARAYGADNLIGGAPEFGWQPVERLPRAEDDPVLGDLPDRFPIFEWHDDTFTLPSDAVHLARSPGAEHQAFRIGRAGYGMQFHFEADTALVDTWTRTFEDAVMLRDPTWVGRRAEEAARHGPEADAAGWTIARNWVALLTKN